jgi:L-threonylcarbamoyladenylate synthase
MEAPVTGYLDRRTIRRAAGILSSGKIAVLPTDTVYGLHCIASCVQSIKEILALKEKAGGGLILLASGIAMAGSLVRRWPGESYEILSRAWPAPLTAVLPAASGVPRILRPRGSAAIRVPAHAALRSLIRIVGEPIVSTSANVSGRPPMTEIAAIRNAFPRLDAYLSRRGRPGALPSTVVDFTGKTPRVARRGRYRWG